MSTARFLVGDVFERMAQLPDGSVDLVMSSPPFLALRSYLPPDHPDKAKEIGSEPTPAEFLDTLLALTAEWRRLLAPHGSICIELGDTYWGSGGAGGDYAEDGLREGQPKFKQKRVPEHLRFEQRLPLDKSLAGIPALYELSLIYGRNLVTGEPSPAGQWRARNYVAWVRPNPPVGALGDKVRPATSYLTWATVARDRWFDLDAVRQVNQPQRMQRDSGSSMQSPKYRDYEGRGSGDGDWNPAGAPPLDWWCIPPGGYPGSHYAVYPPELCRIPIEASCPRRVCRTCGQPSRRETAQTPEYAAAMAEAAPGRAERRLDEIAGGNYRQPRPDNAEYTTTGWSSCGCPDTDGIRLDGFHTGKGWRPGHVLDPFAGSGTTLLVATGLGRDATGIDIDERNADLARDRLGMFLTVEHPEREGAA